MLRHEFSNQQTFHAAQWINNTEEFYTKVCHKVDATKSTVLVAETIKDIINDIVKSVNTGVGSKNAHYMLEDIGDMSQVKFDELARSFLEE